MKYDYNREVFEMNLGINKENVAKIGDLVRVCLLILFLLKHIITNY